MEMTVKDLITELEKFKGDDFVRVGLYPSDQRCGNLMRVDNVWKWQKLANVVLISTKS